MNSGYFLSGDTHSELKPVIQGESLKDSFEVMERIKNIPSYLCDEKYKLENFKRIILQQMLRISEYMDG